MARFKIRIAGVGTGDMGRFEEGVKTAKRGGFNAIACSSLAEVTQDQLDADRSDKWLNFSAISPAMIKLVETSLVRDILSPSHIEKNANHVAEQSRILARCDMTGVLTFREAMWLPESFYAGHPELRGPKCHHPGVAKSPRWAPCLDRPAILEHYREAVRRILEMAPQMRIISICTNDSGGGTCWGTGLYPGPNGPEFCKDVPMARRMKKWFAAMHKGAADAGHKIEVLFNPTHFGREETYTTIENLPPRTRLFVHPGTWPNEPFISREASEIIEASRKHKRGAVLALDPTIGYPFAPLAQRPVPYFALDVLGRAAGAGAEGVAAGPIEPPVDGIETVATAAIFAGLKRPPKSNADVDRAVAKIAKDQVGAKFAPFLASAWRDVDHALRMWPHNADTNHMLYTFYSLIGDRWLVRPIVPAPERLTEGETAYYSAHRHGSRSPRYEHKFFVSENVMNYEIDEFKWAANIYESMLRYVHRAAATLEEALNGIEDGPGKERLARQCRRVAALRCLWRTQRNVLRCGSIIEYFTGAKKEWFWRGKRKDESYYSAPTYRRLFLEAADDEIENCRALIALLKDSDEPPLHLAEQESTFTYGRDLPEQLERKISIMRAHTGDIDILFPDCPPESFTDPTYEWEAEED